MYKNRFFFQKRLLKFGSNVSQSVIKGIQNDGANKWRMPLLCHLTYQKWVEEELSLDDCQ